MKSTFQAVYNHQPSDLSGMTESACLFLEEKTDCEETIRLSGNGLQALTVLCHGLAVESGWWTDPATGERVERNDGELIALMHSELSEALEGLRKNKQDDHLPHRKSVEVELADVLIRIFDYAGARGLDLSGAVIEKLALNQTRADHKLAARAQADGKKF